MKINGWQIAFDTFNKSTQITVKVSHHNNDYEIRIQRHFNCSDNCFACLVIIFAPTISKAFPINHNWPYFKPDKPGFKLLINMILGTLV